MEVEMKIGNEVKDIDGVIVTELKRFSDERGWLTEAFRRDSIDEEIYPVMSYVSMTHPGIVRGPHEHLKQTDYFCFLGTSEFKVYLWDNRKDTPGYGMKLVLVCEKNKPINVIVPPGVVHAYVNIGKNEGLVINYPNQLFAGEGKKEEVDEIRHENDVDSQFKIE
ncbi:MAG: dTDP-4-dehydrorhamnose 3,5-epimerase [PVC group bacterium]|nr:dTDP-4-dehydrorhamnose 3,5-epimerase [PVC group bacterium]